MKKSHWLIKLAAYAAALIFLQTLYFKFTGHADSKFIFERLGVEPYGRIGLGVLELITAILLIIPKTRVYGAVLGMGLILGALLSHLTILGIVVRGDGGLLFGLAVLTFVSLLLVLYAYRKEIPLLGSKL